MVTCDGQHCLRPPTVHFVNKTAHLEHPTVIHSSYLTLKHFRVALCLSPLRQTSGFTLSRFRYVSQM
jgi:hypothetical protein